MALIQAINAFEISIGQQRSGKILPGSPAEAARNHCRLARPKRISLPITGPPT
ncbi:MAG: hypothetical protein ACPG06_04755 [Alphaproteobacteria bacterium]